MKKKCAHKEVDDLGLNLYDYNFRCMKCKKRFTWNQLFEKKKKRK